MDFRGSLQYKPNLSDHRLKRSQLRSQRFPLAGEGPRFRLLQYLSSLAMGMVMGPDNRPNKSNAELKFGNTLLLVEQDDGIIVDWKLICDQAPSGQAFVSPCP